MTTSTSTPGGSALLRAICTSYPQRARQTHCHVFILLKTMCWIVLTYTQGAAHVSVALGEWIGCRPLWVDWVTSHWPDCILVKLNHTCNVKSIICPLVLMYFVLNCVEKKWQPNMTRELLTPLQGLVNQDTSIQSKRRMMQLLNESRFVLKHHLVYLIWSCKCKHDGHFSNIWTRQVLNCPVVMSLNWIVEFFLLK